MGVPNTDVGDKGKKATPKDLPGEDDKDPKDLEGDGADDGDGGESDPGDSKEPKFSDEQKAYIQKLRKESSGYRNKAKGLESKFNSLSEKLSKLEKGVKTAIGVEDDEDVNPDKLKGKLSEKDAQIVQLQSELALSKAADEHGIPAKGRRYFATLISDAAEGLEEGEDLPDETLAEIVKEVKGLFGKSANSSVDDDGKGAGDKKPDSGKGAVTVEKFAKMTTTEKSLLYQKQPDLYNDLFQQAKDKRLLV